MRTKLLAATICGAAMLTAIGPGATPGEASTKCSGALVGPTQASFAVTVSGGVTCKTGKKVMNRYLFSGSVSTKRISGYRCSTGRRSKVTCKSGRKVIRAKGDGGEFG